MRKANHRSANIAAQPTVGREVSEMAENVHNAHAKLNGLDERLHHVEEDVHMLQEELKGGIDEVVDMLRSIEQYVRDIKVNVDLGELRARLDRLERDGNREVG